MPEVKLKLIQKIQDIIMILTFTIREQLKRKRKKRIGSSEDSAPELFMSTL